MYPILVLNGASLAAQAAPAGSGARARVEAVRAERGVRLDGRLEEAEWQRARFIREFVQREPQEGVAASQATEVAFVYTDEALYVGARLREAAGALRALVTRRDREETSDQLRISLDTYRDYRTAYTFAVTAAGVRIDYYHAVDFETARDYSYDPVWQAETQVDSLGWTAEIRIPFSQLRFNAAAQQVWGLNVTRVTPARNEVSYWQLVGRNETGWSSRMGELVGIEGIRPSRRVELLPYLASDHRAFSNVDANNPFAQARTTNWRAGGDLKLGLGPDFTLDATFNPDFGQVEADPAEVNLTAFETFFAERRPFFLEGTQLLNARGNFYSRRIGAPPLLPNAPYSETIDHTSIMGAAKVTGRTARGLSVAALTALTAREEARTFDPASSTRGRVDVAPTTSYSIAAIQKEFGEPTGTSAVGYALLTHVERDLAAGSFLANALVQRATTGIVDYRIRWRGGQYDMSTFVAWSYLQGDSAAILGQQRSSRRYFQRPDADYVEVDAGATTLFGTYFGINHSKLSGKHWLWDIDYAQEAPGFELNDVGRLGAADDRGLFANLRYRETTPGRWLRNYEIGIAEAVEANFGGVRQFGILTLFGAAQLANYWQVNASVDYGTRAQSDNLTRGGPLMGTASFVSGGAGLSNRPGSRTRWRLGFSGNRDEVEGWSISGNASVAGRPGTQLEVSFDPRFNVGVTSRQYLFTLNGGRRATYDRRYVFSYVERSELAARIRINYALTPQLTVETYAEPFASSGRYFDFGELLAPRSRALLAYGTRGTTFSQPDSLGRRTVTDGTSTFTIANNDFNVRSFRSNVVVRWEWRPGSTMFLVWQQNRQSRAAVGGRVNPDDVFDGLSASGNNFFALKVNYWLPVQ
jgi:hypothetical protein